MYCIDDDGDLKDKTITEENTQVQATAQEVAPQDNSTLKQMALFSKQVVEKLIREKIPTTPENYAIYFEKMLAEKPLTQRKGILKILEVEETKEHTYLASTENSVKESFKHIKTILETVSHMYNKINKLKTLTKAKKQELHNGSGQVALVSYEENLNEIVEALAKQQKILKEHYGEISEGIKVFQEESIFDSKYDVYNKSYLFNVLEAEKKNVINFNNDSAILAFKVQESALKQVRLLRDKELIVKSVASMIMKRSRRSDIIGHLGEGTFIMVLKHTDLDHAQKAIESIDNMISFTNYIVDSKSVEIALDYAIAKISPNQTKEQIIAAAINQL